MNHKLGKWANNDARTIATRRYCMRHNDPREYQEAIAKRSDATIAKIELTTLHQYDVLMVKLIEKIKDRFLKEGGIKEEMYRARKDYREKH